MTRGLVAAATLFVATIGRAHALDPRMARSLLRIEPETRLEQVCDIEAMHRIARIKPYVPDRVKSDIVSHPQHDGDTMKAPGAAFRSKGKWYALAFACRGTPDHLTVVFLSLQIGTPIQESRWIEYGLWR